MGIFERFGGPKNVMEELEEQPPQTEEVSPKKDPKTIEDVKNTMGEIRILQSERRSILDKHRKTVDALRDLGVNEYSPDVKPRTETVKDILGPIEEELASVGKQITDLREEFDLQPKHKQVVQERLFRLRELEQKVIDAFYATPSGVTLNKIEHEIDRLSKGEGTPSKEDFEQRNKLEEQKIALFRDDKTAHNFADTLQRIQFLEIQSDDTLKKIDSAEYDERGQMLI